MRNFIAQLPTELLEAARVEGASEWKIFTRIVLPLVKPAIAALSVLIFTFVWNDFFWSLVLTPASPDGMLAPAGLSNIIRGRYYNAWNVMAAGSLLVALPPVIMFFLLQKQFIAGLTLGANKG
jgi:multiple sugar transport system permease protein